MSKIVSRRRNWWLILLGTLGLVGLVALALRPDRIAVEIAKVQTGRLEVFVNDDGITRVKERYTLIAPVSGKMVRLQVHPGDRVEAGSKPIVILEPTDSELLDPRTKLQSQARVKSAQASILRADELKSVALETLELAEHDFHRASELIQSNSVSQSEFDAIEHRYRIAKAELRAADFVRSVAQHELGVAQAVLQASDADRGEPMRLGSPVQGVLLKVMREDAGLVTAGTPILEIGDPRDMEVQIDVLSTAAVSIKPGAKAEIRGWGGSKPLTGRVRIVEPSAFLKISALGVEERRVNVLIDLDEPWQERQDLGDGFRVEANILVDKTKPDVLIVPTSALESSDGKWYVYRVEKTFWQGHCVRRIEVETGLSNRINTEIISGLDLQDRIVLYPPETIQDGSWVTW